MLHRKDLWKSKPKIFLLQGSKQTEFKLLHSPVFDTGFYNNKTVVPLIPNWNVSQSWSADMWDDQLHIFAPLSHSASIISTSPCWLADFFFFLLWVEGGLVFFLLGAASTEKKSEEWQEWDLNGCVFEVCGEVFSPSSPSIDAFSWCMCCSCFSSFRFFFPDRVMFALGLDLRNVNRFLIKLRDSARSQPDTDSCRGQSLTFSSSGDGRWSDPDPPRHRRSDASSSSLD